MSLTTHASVKKPTPATRQTLTWNQLRVGENGRVKWASSIIRELSIVNLGERSTPALVEHVVRADGLADRATASGGALFFGHWGL